MRNPALTAALAMVLCPLALFGQRELTLPDLSPAASVSQTVGISQVTVTYHRPVVNGRKVWGGLVPFGFNDLGFGTSKAAPWRAGANENTLITLQNDAEVAGRPLKAGTYGLSMAIAADGEVTVIFSNDTGSWGSFFYEEAHDALRVQVKWEDAPYHEMLTYDFTDVTKDSAVLALSWERKRIPIPLRFDTKAIVLASIKAELKSARGFRYQTWLQAARYLLDNDLDPHLALSCAEFAVSDSNFGAKNFDTLSTEADALDKLGRTAEAGAVMDEAMKFATVTEIHQYGRRLLLEHRVDRALDIFKLNAQLHPDVWPVNYGLARGFSAKGDYKAALEALLKAQAQVPAGDAANAAAIKVNIDKLKKGMDIN
jgi:tetratricopeptide (TPR) repeat protein